MDGECVGVKLTSDQIVSDQVGAGPLLQLCPVRYPSPM
ncbi:hypothetical protein MetexDRAFT_2833 [Methylorubrum extorquens DSM 13060]|uniref:Uncharacterized protein n=1 Tax=Methylorubrum extorquens DSM 13060 TaxID=882800 RepID=H1KJM1_METEX|nr:hypothetical protein MetexDRAFT_2833 [Methylorubrum extorquens DSM 13060]